MLVLALKGQDALPAPSQLIAPVISRQTFAVQSRSRRSGARRGKIALLGLLLVGAGAAGALIARRSPDGPSVGAAPPAALQPVANPGAAAPALTATLHVDTIPEGAKVKEEGDTLCEATPCDIAYSGEVASPNFEHLLVFMKADYKVERKVLLVTGDRFHQ